MATECITLRSTRDPDLNAISQQATSVSPAHAVEGDLNPQSVLLHTMENNDKP